MSDEELMRFSRENRPLRMEREANGEILIMTPTGFATSKMNQRIGRFLDEWAEADGRGVVTGSDGGYTLPDGSVRAPDAGWISDAALRRLSDAEKDGFAPVCPEFVIELRSRSDGPAELQDKMRMWIANGAELGWLVDPKRRVVEVYRTGAPVEVHENPTSMAGTGCVSDFCLVMERVWG
jgi:Uma2 family endonuclease